MSAPPNLFAEDSGKLIVRWMGMVIAKRTSAESGRGSLRSHFRLPLLVLALLALAGFGADAAWVLSGPVPSFDLSIERDVQAVPWGPLAVAFGWVDWLEGLKQAAAAVAGILLVAVLNRRGLLLMIWGALSAGAYLLIEQWAHRPRPDAHLVHVIRHTSGWSFPSGHALFFSWFLTFLMLTLGRRLPRPLRVLGWGVQAVILALVAIGRVDTAEHWPSDVLAGLLLGAFWVFLGLSVRRLSDPVLDA